jgi:hypothetical protein
VSIHQLIAAICPDVYCQPQFRAKAKSTLRDALTAADKLAYLKAAQVAMPVEPNTIGLERLWEENIFDLPGQRSPVEQHTLTIDNPTEPLEPIYFDLLHELASREEWKIEKLLDTASATPGSGLSLDMSRRSQMDQHENTKILILIRQRIRSFIQDWKKWREQKRQLTFYVQARTPDDPAHESARHRLSHQWQEEAHNVGEDREAAFKQWLHDSETELRTETEIVRHLLADELNFLRLQANWLKPYLAPRPDLRRSDDPALVNAFNTATFEILLLVRMESQLEQMAQTGELPRMLLNRKHRRGEPVMLVEIRFRAIPERAKTGGYAYRGRAQLKFTSYALSEAEIMILRRELQRSEWGEVLGLLETNLAGNLNSMLADLDELLAEPKSVTPAKESEPSDNPNPFTALFDFSGWFGSDVKQARTELSEPLQSDTEPEAVIRSLNLLEARQRCLEIYARSKEVFRFPQFE